MGLEEYEKKRNFSKTAEPEADDGGKERVYVIQEHNASHLHWDLRLGMGGVLKSWAIPKEPPAEKGVKRLCIQTEDHPFSYKDFEGEIPEGQYGAGTVSIWDTGTYDLEEMTEDKMVVDIHGEKLKGKYVLLRFKKAGEGNWLFFKV